MSVEGFPLCQLRCFCCGNGSGVKERASSWTARAVVSSKLFPIDGSYGGEFRSFVSYLMIDTDLLKERGVAQARRVTPPVSASRHGLAMPKE